MKGLRSAFDMGNRWTVKELKHIVNIETWGILADKPSLTAKIKIGSLCFSVIKYG